MIENRESYLKVVSVILGRNINDHIHLFFPHDPLAARPVSRPSNNASLYAAYAPRSHTKTNDTANHSKPNQIVFQLITDKGWVLQGFALRS